MKQIKSNIKKEDQIIELLKSKASTKQEVYRKTKEIFADFQKNLKDKAKIINSEIVDKQVQVVYSSAGDFEAPGVSRCSLHSLAYCLCRRYS